MQDAIKLIEYLDLSGFHISVKDESLVIKNRNNLSVLLKSLIKDYKQDVLTVLGAR